MRSDLADRVLRALLRLPDLVVGWLDGARVVPGDGVGPDDVLPLVGATARGPEAWLALEDGLHYTLAEGHVVAWDHRGRTAFAVGGLNASDDERAWLLRALREDTASRGLVRQLVFPLRAGDLPAATAAGFEAVRVGTEAWLDLPGLTFRGNRYEHVRQLRNRAVRAGVRVHEVDPAACRDALVDVYHRWLASKRPSWRMKLLVGSPGIDAPRGRRFFVARTGRVEAFVTLVPGGPGRVGVDVMARRPDAAKGAMEAILVHVAEALRDEGVAALSLGPCPMYGADGTPSHPELAPLFRFLYGSRLGNRIFGFESLVRFKRKLRPRWEPVYLAAAPHAGAVALYRGCRMWGLY